MKIQELAIIFVIIILPISLLLSEYTQFQIKTITLQTEYDSKLTAATYDAIRAFQLNSTNSATSDLANSKIRDIEASVNSFRNSIMSAFELNGYTEDDLNNYIPALVYTLYDGFYIYSPYNNTHDETGNRKSGDLDSEYGLKPYISYSCRYIKGNNDVVITYALDNQITVQGTVNGKFVNKSGYLIDNIMISGDDVIYNGVSIGIERLKENFGGRDCYYARINGTKYYLMDDYVAKKNAEGETEYLDAIVYSLNGIPTVQYKKGDTQFNSWKYMIENNDSARRYYKEAKEFTDWMNSSGLANLKYEDAYESDGITKIWENNTTTIFKDTSNSIENELSNFNQHRLAVIRHKIETNLAIAISNYNEYSRADNVFQMPELKEDEWEHITHNISLISFLQGLHIGGKVYNGYSIVTNSESKEVVLEDSIYILGQDTGGKKAYHKVGDNGFKVGSVTVNAGEYADGTGDIISAGRLKLDFERNTLISDTSSFYYYPLEDYNASYDSVVMQNNVTIYDDIYQYVNGSDDKLKTAFYTALGRERYSTYKSNNTTIEYYSVLIAGKAAGENNYTQKIRDMLDELSEGKEIKATYIYNNDDKILGNYIKEQKNNYNLIIIQSFAWKIGNNITSKLLDVSNSTNLITISNDQTGLEIMQGGGTAMPNSKAIATQTPEGKTIFGEITINGNSDSSQNAIRFKEDVQVFYEGNYVNRNTGNPMGEGYDLIGCWQNGEHRWIHSQVSLNDTNHMKLLKELVKYALDID